MVDLDVEIIKLLCKEESTPVDHVTVKEVVKALKRLNNNKGGYHGAYCRAFQTSRS